MALTARGNTMAAMCISLGDYDNDGWLDLYISDFQKASDHIWHNDGKGNFEEVSDRVGITGPTKDVLSFGGGFFDYDNDGWLDLFNRERPRLSGGRTSFARHPLQANQLLFHNEGNGKFVETTKVAAADSKRRTSDEVSRSPISTMMVSWISRGQQWRPAVAPA